MKRAERQDHPGRAVLRPEDAELDRAARPAPRCWCCRRRSAASRRSTDYIELFDYDIDLLVDAIKETGSEVDAHGHRPILQFLAAPFVASLILTGIHAYLGVHVVERGVIFVDLSLAQIAALGATIAMLLPFSGGDPHAPSVYWVSLGFTFIGAAVFSTIRSKRARIPQEAIIGICYAVASAAAILAMSKSTSEAEHLKDMLVGNILAVSWPEVRQDRRALRRRRRCSTTSSASGSWPSR